MATMTRKQIIEVVRNARWAGRRIDLTNANLFYVNLTRADLRGANLRSANLTDANLRRANLTDANLTDADLIGADLTNADLAGANLAGADLREARVPRGQLLNTRGLRPWRHGLPHGTWDAILPANPEQRQLVEHLLNDGWGGTLREAIATVEGLAGR